MGGFYPARFALPFSLCLCPRPFFLSFVRLALAVISRSRADFYNCLMVVYDFYIVEITISLSKAYAVLIVDANAVLPLPVSVQLFEVI